MPRRSRDRRRGYEPEWDRHRDANRRSKYPDSNDSYDYDYDDSDVNDAEERRRVDRDRRRSRHQSDPRARSNRRYDPYDRYDEGGVREDEDDDDYDDDEESEIIVVDSRPNFSRPPNVRPSPRRRSSPPPVDGRQRSRNHKAKESPATSPKKRDRERDRDGHRRRRDSIADEDGRARLRERAAREKSREKDIADARARSRGELKKPRPRDRDRERERDRVREKHASSGSANSATQLLSADALSKLDAYNAKKDAVNRSREAKEEKERDKQRKKKDGFFMGKLRVNHSPDRDKDRERGRHRGHDRDNRRHASGAMLEEGRSPELRVRGGGRYKEKWRDDDGGGGDDDDSGGGGWFSNWSRKKKIWITVGTLALLLAIVIPVGIVVSKKKSPGNQPDNTGSKPANDNLKGINPDSIPQSAKGSYFDPFTWYDTANFNLTYTDETVGGLPIMGLFSSWDDSAQANEHVPPLDKPFAYGKQPIRGVSVGGWLSMEPFITPSYFSKYSVRDDVVDEWTLTARLGSNAKLTLEKHYSSFITEESFKGIRDAGMDHVRIPYSYWAVKTFEGDPYVERVSWRYLLRAIEYCRKYGLRVNLDLHGLPGSQNGWNHSGRQGLIRWLNGTDGDQNAQRALDVHNQLSQFFAQPRYKNVIAMYGLANEPLMLKLPIEPVIDWTTKAAEIVTKNGMKQYIVFGDGFLKLSKWTNILQNTGYNFLLDTHQYTIFNTALISLKHEAKLEFVCDGWVKLISDSNTKGTGWGPTICGEWSQADTDCAKYLNNVNVGTRWTGTMDSPTAKDQVFKPLCPAAAENKCSCDPANADPSSYSDAYKQFLQTYAEAQMSAFEKGWGWFYWTWETESAVQWSWRRGLEAGILPKKAYAPSFKCGETFPKLNGLPESY